MTADVTGEFSLHMEVFVMNFEKVVRYRFVLTFVSCLLFNIVAETNSLKLFMNGSLTVEIMLTLILWCWVVQRQFCVKPNLGYVRLSCGCF